MPDTLLSERFSGLPLDRSSGIPLYRQIAEGILAQIRQGAVAAGTKLPSTRILAKQLAVHRRTIVASFRLLEEGGWVVAGVGQGTFVNDTNPERLRPSANAELWSASADHSHLVPVTSSEHLPPLTSGSGASEGNPSSVEGRFPWDLIVRKLDPVPEFWQYWTRDRSGPGMIRFTGATADPALFPVEDIRQALNDVFRCHGAEILEYGPTEGYAPLRDWVAERLRQRGVVAGPEQVLIVSGSQQGLHLLSRLLIRTGDTVGVEEPGYTSGFRLFQTCGARVVGLPMDGGGIRCDHLDELLSRHRPRFLYLMPNFQNPTGLSLAEDRVDRLLGICARRGVPIVEDQFDADLYYDGAPPRPLKERDEQDQVILLGSFSKILFPGLRLGWLVVPAPLLAPLRELKQLSDFTSSLVAQCAMESYCRQGLLDRHLESVRRIYGRRLQVMLEAMEKEFPPEARWSRPRGGLTLWVDLPPGIRAFEFWQQARREGVDFSPGPVFYPNGGGASQLRLSYIRETEERIRHGIAILGAIMKSMRTREAASVASGPFF